MILHKKAMHFDDFHSPVLEIQIEVHINIFSSYDETLLNA